MKWAIPVTLAAGGAGAVLLWWLRGARRFPPFAQRVLIGDSLAVGLRPHLLALGTIRRSEIVPKEGTTTAQWLGRTLPLGAYLISLGTNDMAGAGLTATQVQQMNARLGDTIWLIPPPMPTLPRYAEVVDIIRRNARVVEPPADLARAADKIHLPSAGYQRWAAAIAAALGQPPAKPDTGPPVKLPGIAGWRPARQVSPEMSAKAQAILASGAAIGAQTLYAGNMYRVEWHKHAPGDPVPDALKEWHRGVTVYEPAGAA